jgi:hypothetical protein
VDDLVAHIENGTDPSVRLVPGKLILRGTVRAAKKTRSRSAA